MCLFSVNLTIYIKVSIIRLSYWLFNKQAELGPSRNSTLKRVEENGEPEEVEEKFMAEERITEKEEFTPQQYSHQSSKLSSLQIEFN